MKKNKKDYGIDNNTNLKLVIALARSANKETRRTSKMLTEYGLTISQFGVLELLYHMGDMCINEILKKTLSTSGNITVVIKNLERDGFITKVQKKEDKRKMNIHITQKGVDIIEEIFPEHLDNLKQNFNNLSSSEKLELINLLKKLNKRV